jgi:hypothetical protein
MRDELKMLSDALKKRRGTVIYWLALVLSMAAVVMATGGC